ncbi:SCY1-like protein 2 [Toxocara canis]|uniref:SCY1-like protein 2 n=1 Tax=Toxocara canis TaxID=6265 RepID=A0A0B2VFV0_TOXCA|nr:SCY1-like protein 2 [Toxocara canis]
MMQSRHVSRRQHNKARNPLKALKARLETRKMDYLNKLRSTVSSVAAQVSNALPGNPVTREYEILSQIASAGPGLSWKIYAGRKHSTKQAVAVWLFDKKDLDRWPRHEKELFTEVLRRGVAQLTRLRHPRILVIEHPLEESRDSFAFCTEPMFASLANCLGRHENLAPAIPTHLIDFEFVDVEIRHGLFQLAEALSFLHIDARMLHRNICPESVVINDRGAWKLAGFDFAVQATPSSSGQLQFEMVEWEERTMSLVQPSLDYLAPEYVLGGRCDTYADIFSLGVLSIAIFNHCRPPFEHRNSLENFRKDAEKLKALPASVLVNVPAEFREDVKMCLNFTPDLRPDATQFSKIVYFDNALTKTLNYFDSLCQMDNAQKMQFFKTLPQVLADFPKRPLLQKVLPYLSAEFSTPDLIPFILPSVFLIAELSSDSEFATVILPQLIPVFAMDRPYQIVLMLLQKMELLLQKTPDEDIRRHVLPLIYNAISSEVTRIQELCLSIIPNVGKLVDRDSMKTHLLPKLLRLAVEGGVLSLAEALSFLHIDARMLHRNICPESVVINDRGAWKLAGFDFAVQATPSSSGQLQFEMVEWEERTMSLVQPSLDYLAPEYVLGGRCDTYADIFSLGVLSIAIFNHCRPPFEHRNSLENFRKDAEKLKALPASVLVNVPAEFREDVKMCLNFTPDLRPDATQFSKIVYFDNALTKTLNYFDSLCQMDNAQKMQFFKTLPQVLADFPKRPLLQKVLPYLSAEFSTPDLIPFILPSVFLIAELSSDSEFATVILPQLIPVFAMDRPYQIVLMLLQKMELLLQKTPDEDIRRHVLPLIYNAISSEVTRIQELCLSIIPNVGKLVDRDSMKTHLLPKLLRLAVEGGVLSVRVQALICLGKLMPTLEPWMVSDQILPALPKVNSKEPGVLMAILGIYKLAYEDARFGIAREQCAKSVLPFLIATSVENTLNLQQFEQFFAIINVMLHKVETEQRQRLQQLSASQEEQRNIPDFNEVLASAHTNKNTTSKGSDGLAELVNGTSGSAFNSPAPTAFRKNTGPLSLEEKKRLAAEQEQNVRMRTQPSILQPATSEGVTARIILPKRQQTPQRSLSPLDSLLDAQPEGSILSPSVTSHAQSFKKSADIDLSEFLPPSSNQTAVTKSTAQVSPLSGAYVMNFPATPAFGATPSIEQQFGGSLDFRSGPTFTGLPQPPQSQNPVHRNVPGFGRGVAISANMRHSTPSNGKPDLSAFDGLLSFQKGAISAPMNSISKPSVSTMLPRNSTVTSEQKPKQVCVMNFPATPAFGATPSIEQQFGGSLDFRSGPTFTGLPQPPQSQNPVHRNVPGFGRGVAISANMRHSTPSNGKPDLSAFDGLLSFQKGAISAPMNSISKPSVSTMLPRNSTVTSEQKPKQVFNGKDPFADLFGLVELRSCATAISNGVRL